MNIKLRPLKESDYRFIYNLRFSDDVVKVSVTKARPQYKNHCEYMRKYREEYKIIILGDQAIGFIRQDAIGYISIAITKETRIKGIGTHVLSGYTGKAIIKTDNVISLVAFLKAGFILKGYYLIKPEI